MASSRQSDQSTQHGGSGTADRARRRPGRAPHVASATMGATRGASARLQILRNTSVPFVPPKPKPFETDTSTFASRAVCGT